MSLVMSFGDKLALIHPYPPFNGLVDRDMNCRNLPRFHDLQGLEFIGQNAKIWSVRSGNYQLGYELHEYCPYSALFGTYPPFNGLVDTIR